MNTRTQTSQIGENIYDDTIDNDLNKVWASSSSFEAVPTAFTHVMPTGGAAHVNKSFVGSTHSIDLTRLAVSNDALSMQRPTRYIDFSSFMVPGSTAAATTGAVVRNEADRDQTRVSVLPQKFQQRSVSFQAISDPKTTARRHKFCLKLCILIGAIIVSACIGLVILASIKPCAFTKCNRLASLCIDRFPFWAQCICDDGYAGNGKTVCVECGVDQVRPNLLRIVGGVVAVPSSWPFAVYIVQTYKGRFNIKGINYIISNSWSCGGVLINPKTVLTAAHCIHEDKFEYQDDDGEIYLLQMQWNEWYSSVESTLEVYVGVNDIAKINSTSKLRIKKVNRHEDYDEFDFKNDIATIQLYDTVERSLSVQYACLPYNYSTSYPEIDRRAYIIGWGRISEIGDSSDLLRNSVVYVLNSHYCAKVEEKIPKYPNSQVCAGVLDGSTDTCQGDSGGGLFVRESAMNSKSNANSNRSLFYVAGVVSYGEGCARPDKPGIYSRTSYYIDWIRQNSDF